MPPKGSPRGGLLIKKILESSYLAAYLGSHEAEDSRTGSISMDTESL